MATVYGPLTREQTLDAAIRLMTMWRSWSEMEVDLQRCNASYAPTLRDDDNVAPEQRHKDAIALIREACDRAGFRWYDGNELHNDPSVRRRRGKGGQLGLDQLVLDRIAPHDRVAGPPRKVA